MSFNLEHCRGINHLWASVMVEEFVRCGVRNFCIAPGGQSTPLVVAVAEHPEVNTIVHHDERGLAFYALGQSRAQGTPSVLICTSGTAVANFYPAVVEAASSRSPLIVLTADLPAEMTGVGVNQSIDQTEIFSNFLRWKIDFPAPESSGSLAFLLSSVDEAVYRAAATERGPVQLNCRFRAPLLDFDTNSSCDLPLELSSWSIGDSPYRSYAEVEYSVSDASLDELTMTINQAKRGLIVLGHQENHVDNSAVVSFAEKLNWPVLAEVNSGLRFGQLASSQILSSHFVTYLGCKYFLNSCQPDVVLHLGGDLILHVKGEPINGALHNYLKSSSAKYLAVNEGAQRQDPLGIVDFRIEASPNTLCLQLIDRVDVGSSELMPAFVSAEDVARRIIADEFEADHATVSEIAVVQSLASRIPEQSGLFLSNSLPIREFDILASAARKNIAVASQNGVKGIDGTIASAVGFAEQLSRPTTLLIGDVAFLHDLNSLALLDRTEVPLTIVLVNNDGGAIFAYVSAGQTPQFEDFFCATHGYTFEAACRQFRIEYYAPRTTEDFKRCYAERSSSGKSTVIEVITDRNANMRHKEELFSKIHKAVEETLM